jgi:hypothetical protein
MRSAIRVSALLILFGGCLGLVTAHQRAATVDETVGHGTSYAEIIDDYDREIEATGSTGTTGGINLAAVPRLSLSDEERGLVFLGVINLPNVPELAMRAPEAGVPLAKAIELQEIPAMVVRRIPELRGYKFVKLEDRILVVSAEARQVEAMIPRYKLVFH